MSRQSSPIYMVIQKFSPYIGGAEKQALSLAKTLKEKSQDVVVLTGKMAGQPSEEEIDGITVRRLWGGGLLFFFSSLFHLISHMSEYNTIHVHLASSHALSSALVGRIWNKQVIVKIGGGRDIGEIYVSRHSFFGRMKLWGLRCLKPEFVIVSETQRAELVEAKMDNLVIHHIPNGVNLKLFHPVKADERDHERQQLGWKGMVGLFVGRFSPDKLTVEIFENVIKGLVEARKENDQIRLVFIGEGPLKNQYETIIDKYQMGSSVEFLSMQSNIGRFYRAADFFLLPSMMEGLSNALLEALATGIPVAASRVPGIADFVTDGVHGVLFDPHKPNEIMESFKKVLTLNVTSSNTQLAQAYSLDTISDRYLSLYSKNVKKGP